MDVVVTPLRPWIDEQYTDMARVPNGYCPNHSTGVTLPADFKVKPLQYVD